MLLQNLTENMHRDLTKLWLTQKGHEKKLTRLERFYEQLKNELMEETRFGAVEQIAQEEKSIALKKLNDADRVHTSASDERKEDFYDDNDFDGSEEDDSATWYDEEDIPGISEDDSG